MWGTVIRFFYGYLMACGSLAASINVNMYDAKPLRDALPVAILQSGFELAPVCLTVQLLALCCFD